MSIVIPTVGYFIKAVQRLQVQIAVLLKGDEARDKLCQQHQAWLLASANEIKGIAINVAVLVDRGQRVDLEHRYEREADGRTEGT
jgi:hypothetical protein